MTVSRRSLLAAGLAAPTWLGAQAQQGHHAGQFERLNQPGRIDLPELHAQQAVIDSPAPLPLPVARDHTGIVVVNQATHVLGDCRAWGRVDSFHTNSDLHHSDEAATDRWTFRSPLPTARSGQGCVLCRDKVFVMGGEGSNRVYGQNEAWGPLSDHWQAYAPMLTPRHGMGAVVLGDAIHVAGGSPQLGGGVKSAINESFSLA